MDSVVNKRPSEIMITLFCQMSWEQVIRDLTVSQRSIQTNNVIYCYSKCISLNQEFPSKLYRGILQP